MFDKENYYFRVKYKKLNTECRLLNGLRCDMKFDVDLENKFVFSLYPEFQTLSEENIVGDEWEALDEGYAIIHKPFYPDMNGYFDMIRKRVKVGAKAYFVGGAHQIAELEIVEIINDI